MCGRYTLHTSREQVIETFKVARDLVDRNTLFSRYNIAPSQTVAAIRVSTEDGVRELVPFRWGLIPQWTKEPRTEYSTINARAETVAEKPAFRAAFRQRRCLIIADGFFEWAQPREGKGKDPWYITMRSGQPFAFAGLWERWEPSQGSEAAPVESSTIIVTDANELLGRIHDRMPVILNPADYDTWLDPKSFDRIALTGMLRPFDAEKMEMYPVSRHVNSPKYDDPTCIEAVTTDG